MRVLSSILLFLALIGSWFADAKVELGSKHPMDSVPIAERWPGGSANGKRRITVRVTTSTDSIIASQN